VPLAQSTGSIPAKRYQGKGTKVLLGVLSGSC
jgi:hypothetical protein